jgi:hypothetical protein
MCDRVVTIRYQETQVTTAEMSSQSVAGTNGNIDATLNAILCRLDTIELKMEPLQPLQDQVAILETAVQDQAT